MVRSPSVARILLSGAGWNVLAQATPVIVNLALTPFLIHGIGLTQFGIYSLVATITVFLASFNGGIGPTAQRFFSVYAGREDRVATTRLLCTSVAMVTGAGAVFALADWFAVPLLIHAFGMPARYYSGTALLLRTFGVLVVVSLLHSLLVSLLKAHQRFGLTSKSVILSYLAWSGGVVLAVEDGWGLKGIALALIAEQVVASALVLPFIWAYLSGDGLGFMSWSDLRRFFGFALRVQMTGISSLVNMQFDALIIGAFFPVRYVGLYNAGANPATQAGLVATAVLPPAANRLATTFARDGEAAAKSEMAKVQRLWVVGTTGWCAAALGAAYFGVLAWLGPQFRTAALVCTILLAGYAVNLLTGVMTAYAGAVGQPGVETRYGVVAMVINVALTVPLLFVGVLGVVGATAVGSALGSFYLVRLARRYLGRDLPNFLLDVPVVPALICFGVTLGLEALVGPSVPRGPLGLVLCGLPALVGLILFSLSWLGPRRFVTLAKSLRERRLPLDMLLEVGEAI